MPTGAHVATGTIRVSRFVKLSGNFSVAECDANESIYGVSQEFSRVVPIPSETADPPQAAQSGEALNVHHTPGEIVLIRVGSGGVTYGSDVESDADGQAVIAATTAGTVRNLGGKALETASEGEYARMELRPSTRTVPAA